jgi:hypothetical protein
MKILKISIDQKQNEKLDSIFGLNYIKDSNFQKWIISITGWLGPIWIGCRYCPVQVITLTPAIDVYSRKRIL